MRLTEKEKKDTWSVPLFPQSQSGSGGAKTLEEGGDLRNFLFFPFFVGDCAHRPRLLQKKRVTGGIVPLLGGFRLAPCAIAGGEREEEEKPRQAQGVIRPAQRRRKGIKIFLSNMLENNRFSPMHSKVRFRP